MDKLITTHDRGTAVAGVPKGNPDGKASNGFMLDWVRTEPRGLAVKPQKQVLAEFFTSMLVLSAEFKYEPTKGDPNHLYFIDGEWRLSLIAPEQWTDKHRAGHVGTCVLQNDMTWTIDPSENLMQDGPIAEAIARFFDAFAETLDTDLTLEEILPFYVRRMPYWQRLYASALSRSIRGVVTLSDLSSIRARDWQQALPAPDRTLLLSY